MRKCSAIRDPDGHSVLYWETIAPYDGVGTCGHQFFQGDTIGWQNRHIFNWTGLLGFKARHKRAVCASCWSAKIAKDEMESLERFQRAYRDAGNSEHHGPIDGGFDPGGGGG